jgi:hypothetical protein
MALSFWHLAVSRKIKIFVIFLVELDFGGWGLMQKANG